MIKLSIIVPVYNVEDYIRKCLDSLVNQTLEEIEIIVINDGSPDNSQNIIDEFVKKYPNKIKSFIKENGGQGSARNLGLKKCKGKYVSFVDSDDFLDKNFALEMYNLAIKDKSDVVVCDMIDIFEDGKTKYYDVTHFKNIYETTPSVCNKIFKKDLFNDLKFLSKLWYEDLNIMYKMYPKINKISTIHKAYYNCNCRKVSTMHNNNSLKNLDILTVLDDSKVYLEKNNCFDEEIFNQLVFEHVLISTIDRVENQDSKNKTEVIEEIIKYCQKNIPNYKNFSFYKEVPLNRKIVSFLNYHHLSKVSKILINLKQRRR